VKFSYPYGEGDPAETNETYRAASAIAAFDAIQVAFAALMKKGILSKAEAEQILREAIETSGGAGDQTAELLAIALEKILPQVNRPQGVCSDPGRMPLQAIVFSANRR
jgi:hypothetical protein